MCFCASATALYSASRRLAPSGPNVPKRTPPLAYKPSESQSRPGLRPQAPPGLASTKSLRSYPLAERDSLLRQRRCAAALAKRLASHTGQSPMRLAQSPLSTPKRPNSGHTGRSALCHTLTCPALPNQKTSAARQQSALGQQTNVVRISHLAITIRGLVLHSIDEPRDFG
jgi:hypothetical protein